MNNPTKIKIAVLPFVNHDLSTRYLSDGIADALIGKLATIPEVSVTSRTSSFQFRTSEMSIRAIAGMLEANVIVEGNVRFLGDRVKLLVNLVSSDQDEVLWSSSWETKLEKLFDLENEIAESVAENIRDNFCHFDLEDSLSNTQPNVDIQSYQLFLKANYLQFNWVVSDALEALALYDQVIDKAPDFFDAYIFKIACFAYLRAQMAVEPKEADAEIGRIMNILEQAKVHNADLYVAKAGYLFWGFWNFKEAFEELRKALELNPSHSEVHNLLGLMYALSGKESLAKKHFEHAIQLDPLSANKHITKAWGLYALGKFEDALVSYDEAMKRNPKIGGGGGLPIRIKSLMAIGRNLSELYREIAENKEIAPIIKEGLLGLVAANIGDADATELHSSKLLSLYESNRNEQVAGFLMQIYNRQGNESQAIEWLKKGFENQTPMLVGLIVDPALDNLQANPEFKKIKLKLKPLSTEMIRDRSIDKNIPPPEWISNNEARLTKLMTEKQPYLDSSINLRRLANELDISRNALSWLINNQFGQNFNEFINNYRIEAFKERVKDPLYSHLSLLGIALESGFNSKASFNTVFKKITGQTPREFSRDFRN